ncbi:MAG TPA: DUF1361 domain-containing protein [Verrucomicrobiae bacterium]|nr:DUF1361 domain-containing protein [Verrucomicrobiae bacterium]
MKTAPLPFLSPRTLIAGAVLAIGQVLSRTNRILCRRETLAPMAALAFGSAVGLAVIFGRFLLTGRLSQGFLVWNLFLAWIPLGLALFADDEFRHGARRKWLLLGLAAGWLLFFPNSPYIFTDLTHLRFWFHNPFWVELTLILLFAFTGLLVGFLSLYLMQALVAETCGRAAGWVFVLATTALSSFGVYIGRFLRLNSWDVVLRPGRIFRTLDTWTQANMWNGHAVAFLLLFAAFLFVAYVMLHALTHLGSRTGSSLANQSR